MLNKRNLFRGYFYLRMGWSTYIAFIMAATNTLTISYFLIVENYPSLLAIFPSFIHYVSVGVSVGIPILILIGYLHFKRTQGFKAEADINIEMNPHGRRQLINGDLSLLVNLELLQFISRTGKLSAKEKEELTSLDALIKQHMKSRTEF